MLTAPSLNRSAKIFMISLASLSVAACSSNLSPKRYDAYAVGEVNRAERGEIISSRWVEIRKGNSGVGTATGIAAGAAAGSTVGNGAEGVIGALGGALIGGLIGSSVDKKVNKTHGFEYLVRTETGDTITLVQADRQPIPNGAPVLIVYNRDMTRLILDESRIDYGTPTPLIQRSSPQNGPYQGRISSQSATTP